tara:strand:- start:3539 stop:4495 length:957 start_codon:yes stop_codon:yes gene_type:complete
MRYLITGHTGFVGDTFCRLLIDKNKNSELILISRRTNNNFSGIKNVLQINCDLTQNFNFELLRKVDIFINFAGEIKSEEKMFDLHVVFLQRCFNYIKTNNLKIFWVQLSSVGSYGNPIIPHQKRLVEEDFSLSPNGSYEKSKSKADMSIVEFSDAYKDFTFCILRPSQIIGKDMINQSLLNLINIVKKRLYFTIRSRKNVRSYVHIEDLCNAIFLVIENHDHKSKNKIFNVSQNILLERIVQEIRNKYNTKLFIPFIVNEKAVRIAVNFLNKFLKLPITNQIISGLVARSIYSSNSIKKNLNFEFKHNKANVILKVDE